MDQPSMNVGGVIAGDIACIRCGYNLRGLTQPGQCPECGAPVTDSLRGDLLRFSNPDWLERIRFGTSLKLWNIGLAILAGFAAGILVAVGVPLVITPVIKVLVGLAGGVLGLWASFAITTQEPRISMQEDPVTLRKVIRTCASAAFAGSVISSVNDLVGVGLVLMVITFLLTLAGVVSSFGELIYYRRFALRIPDPVLAKSTKKLMWFLPVIIGLLLVLAFLAAITGAIPGTSGPGPGGVGSPFFVSGLCFGGLLGLVAVLWYVRLLTKYSRARKSAVAEARAGVSSDAAPTGLA